MPNKVLLGTNLRYASVCPRARRSLKKIIRVPPMNLNTDDQIWKVEETLKNYQKTYNDDIIKSWDFFDLNLSAVIDLYLTDFGDLPVDKNFFDVCLNNKSYDNSRIESIVNEWQQVN